MNKDINPDQQSGNQAFSPVLVVAPTLREVNAVKGLRYEGLATAVVGIGKIAHDTVSALLTQRPWITLLSIGYAGALKPELRCGDIVIGNSYARFDDRCLNTLARSGRSEGSAQTVGGITGSILTVNSPLSSAEAKLHAHVISGASVVDMEGWWIAQAAKAHGTRLVSLRVVLDEAGFALPGFVGRIISDAGKHEILHTLRSLHQPDALLTLIPLALRSRKASRSLARATNSLVPRLMGRAPQ